MSTRDLLVSFALPLISCSAPDAEPRIVERCVSAAGCETSDDPELCRRLCEEKPYRNYGREDRRAPESTSYRCHCWGCCGRSTKTEHGAFRANNEAAAFGLCLDNIARGCTGPLVDTGGSCL